MKEKRYPIGWHPANEEEAVARIEAIEAEYERTGKATDFEEFKSNTKIILAIMLCAQYLKGLA